MRIAIEDAHALLNRVMAKLGYEAGDVPSIVDHLIDCELRGVSYGGLARAVSITERIGRTGLPTRPIAVTHESPVSARIDGADHIGYIVGQRATDMAIEKASAMGLSAVGADDTWYTGMLSYFAEQAAAHDLVTMIASNATPWVAPHGAAEGRFGTNPICFGFPSQGHPIVWDIGTSTIMHAEVLLARRQGLPLPEGRAFGPDGRPTTDPDAALAGAFTSWGGHKGSGLGLVVQMLGVLAGSGGHHAGPRRLRHGHRGHPPGHFRRHGRLQAAHRRLCRERADGEARRSGKSRPHALRPLLGRARGRQGLRRVRGGRGHCRAPAGLRRLEEPPLRG